MKLEEEFERLVLPAKDYSMFEKYIYAYDIVKNYRPYKEDINDGRSSRDPYCILESDFLVCTGFSLLFGHLLDKLEIPSIYLESVISKTENESDKIRHARRYSYLYDPKYEIDGLYISDPTWDNNDKYDLYEYVALTPQEMEEKEDFDWLIEDSVFYARNKEELIKMLEVLYRRSINNDFLIFLQEKILKKIEILDPKRKEKIRKLENELLNTKDISEKINILNEEFFDYFLTLTHSIKISEEKLKSALEAIYSKEEVKNKSLGLNRCNFRKNML